MQASRQSHFPRDASGVGHVNVMEKDEIYHHYFFTRKNDKRNPN
jgi:hypothetical protein